jgi:predicted ATPase
LSREHGLPLFAAAATSRIGWARWWNGDEAGETEFREGLVRFEELDFRTYGPHSGTLLAELEARSGHIEDALANLEKQLKTVESTGECWMESEIHRVRGDVYLLRCPGSAEAERCFDRACAIARRQQTRVFELRAALPLSNLYRTRGRNDDAAILLESALSGLSEDVDLPEAREARGVLESLAN